MLLHKSCIVAVRLAFLVKGWVAAEAKWFLIVFLCGFGLSSSKRSLISSFTSQSF